MQTAFLKWSESKKTTRKGVPKQLQRTRPAVVMLMVMSLPYCAAAVTMHLQAVLQALKVKQTYHLPTALLGNTTALTR